jgi:thymidine phosphorylase
VDADVDPAAGIEILLPPGADVREGEPLLVVSGRDRVRVDAARVLLAAAVRVVEEAPPIEPLIRDTLDGASGA